MGGTERIQAALDAYVEDIFDTNERQKVRAWILRCRGTLHALLSVTDNQQDPMWHYAKALEQHLIRWNCIPARRKKSGQ